MNDEVNGSNKYELNDDQVRLGLRSVAAHTTDNYETTNFKTLPAFLSRILTPFPPYPSFFNLFHIDCIFVFLSFTISTS